MRVQLSQESLSHKGPLSRKFQNYMGSVEEVELCAQICERKIF